MSLAPGDPTLWNGVIFVRSGRSLSVLLISNPVCEIPSNWDEIGPYGSAVLRFQIRFPASYPDLPPLVTFSTDVFHPLIVPLTTYTFSTNASTEDPVSASDEERLPPGGFSLRHGFPHWFGRAKRSGVNSPSSSRAVSRTDSSGSGAAETQNDAKDSSNDASHGEKVAGLGKDRVSAVPSMDQFAEPRKAVPVPVLLNYIRSTFDDEFVLDSLPLEAAGNPGAWHAWRAHRRGVSSSASRGDSKKESPQARQPGDWHWDGIWAKRVQSEIEASHSDQILFGNVARGSGDEAVSCHTYEIQLPILRGCCMAPSC